MASSRGAHGGSGRDRLACPRARSPGARSGRRTIEPPGEATSQSTDRLPEQRRSLRTAAAVVVLTALVGLSAVTLVARGPDACPPPGAALQVGGRAVTVDELERRSDVLGILYGMDLDGGTDEGGVDAFLRDLAQAVAVEVIVAQEVRHRRLQATDEAIRGALERFVAERFPEGGWGRFVAALANQGVSEAEVLDEFRRPVETRRLFEAVTAGVTLTEEELEGAFGERRESLAVRERRRLRHLVVATEEQAGSALHRVREGEGFGAVAAEVSLDGATREQGGELGFLPATELDPAFAAAAFSAPPGQPFGPVQTEHGWHVGIVEDVMPGRPVTFEEVRDSLRQQLLREERLAVWQRFVGRQMADARVCYADRFRPADPDAPPPEVAPDPAPAGSP